MSLKYPLAATSTGDLALDAKVYPSRIRLYLDCSKSDRPMLPEFGSTIQPYLPDEYDALQAEALRGGLERYCKAEGEAVAFSVTPSGADVLGAARLAIAYTTDS